MYYVRFRHHGCIADWTPAQLLGALLEGWTIYYQHGATVVIDREG